MWNSNNDINLLRIIVFEQRNLYFSWINVGHVLLSCSCRCIYLIDVFIFNLVCWILRTSNRMQSFHIVLLLIYLKLLTLSHVLSSSVSLFDVFSHFFFVIIKTLQFSKEYKKPFYINIYKNVAITSYKKK